MTQEITMGSLFSGSGGFELAGSIFGIRPIWASEIEPFPILVTTKNFPEMKHLGDINKLNGADLEPVTIIAGGSPCQDMSIAGKREGLDGSRSNLFREQIRIIKEMRESDRAAGRTGTQIRPRYMVWENVPGAFSSNKGKDFQAVLQEIVSITDEESNVPLPPKGKWQTAGCIMGDHFTIAWRVLDAQYWAEELGITEPTQEDIDHWREVFRTQMEAMGESKKEKTDNQICKWLKDPESDSAKYKMWGNGIALPCAMFVMEGIAMILSREDTDEQK